MRSLKGSRVFVTGAFGFVGSHLTIRLLEMGCGVTVLNKNFEESPILTEDFAEELNIVDGVLEDLPLMRRTIIKNKIDIVFHLAAQTQVESANANPLETFESNIRGTYNLLEACRSYNKVKLFVFASSDKAYGSHKKLPYKEDSELKGTFPYDASKACGEALMRTYGCTYNMPTVVTRCGNIFGPGDLNFRRIVPGTIRSLVRNERPLIRSDGNYVRDYVYVDDVVTGYIAAASAGKSAGVEGNAFNFSYGRPMRVLQMVRLIAMKMGKAHIKPVILGEARNEIISQYLDASKAKRLLCWDPAYDVDTGLDPTIDWYLNYLRGKKARAGRPAARKS